MLKRKRMRVSLSKWGVRKGWKSHLNLFCLMSDCSFWVHVYSMCTRYICMPVCVCMCARLLCVHVCYGFSLDWTDIKNGVYYLGKGWGVCSHTRQYFESFAGCVPLKYCWVIVHRLDEPSHKIALLLFICCLYCALQMQKVPFIASRWC